MSAKAKSAPARRTRLTSGGRRSQILEAAMRVFAERGFHGVRTRELAEAAGVSEALVFRHFPTKESIVRAILDEVGFAERIQEMEARLEAMPPREALLSIAENLLTRLKDDPGRFRVVFFGLLEKPHLASEFYQQFLSRVLALETRIFKRAYAVQGDNLPGSRVDPSVAARSFHGSLIFYNMSGAIVRMEPLPKNPKRLAEAIVDLYLPVGGPHGR